MYLLSPVEIAMGVRRPGHAGGGEKEMILAGDASHH